MLKKITLFTAAATSVFAMHSAQININDKDLELGAKLDMGQFNHAVEPDTVFFGAKFLKADGENSDPEVSNLDEYYELNFLMQREVSNTGLFLGLGVKLNHVNRGETDFTSIPLGIEAKYKLPISDVVPFYLGGAFYYAPESLSLQDAHSFQEFRINLDIEVIKNANVTMGYRSLETDYEVNNHRSDFTYNKSAYIGFKFLF